jgi:hypothetical protein
MVFVSGSEYVQNLNRLFIIKKCSNSDGKQFHQYQQNKQWSLTEHKKTTTYDTVNRRQGLEQAQTCGGIKSVMIFQPLPW